MVRNPQDAEEAFQLTMVAAYRALSAGRGPRGALRPWLFRIAHNECVDVLRARPPVEELTDRHPVPGRLHERVEAREAIRQLNDDIAALPLRQRAAFVLHEIDGLPHAAVGEALGTSDLGARRLLHEARTTLEEFHAGRALACDDVRVRIGAGDRRILRARGISAHLRGCASCRAARAAVQPARGRRRLLVAAATVALVAGMVAVGVRSLAAAPAAGEPRPAPVAAAPAPVTGPSPGAPAPTATPAPVPRAAPPPPAAPAPAAPAATPPPAPPRAPDPEIATVQAAPAPVPAPAPPPAAAPAEPAAPALVVPAAPEAGAPSALAAAPSEEAPPPNHKPGHPAPPPPAEPSAPAPAPEPPGEVVPQEETPAPMPGAPELAPAPPAADAPAPPPEAPPVSP
jgi:RNA polymerase sigma factor (sigma-70 family)